MDVAEPQTGDSMQDNPETAKFPTHIMSGWFASFNSKHKRLVTELMVDIQAVGHPRLPEAFHGLQEYWRCRRHVIKPTSWEEFLEYRFRHAGCQYVYCPTPFSLNPRIC